MIRRFTWDIVYHESINSTNSLLYEHVSGNDALKEGYVLRTDYQSSGKGQIGNTWESKPGKNLLTSIFLKPELLVEEQFLVSKIICLAIVELLNDYDLENIRIKWPNDIYVNNKKIAGILIQNILQGKHIKASIIGVGMNVNQEVFESDAPNPTSLQLELKEEQSVGNILIRLLDKLDRIYAKITLNQKTEIDNLYKFLLYKRNVKSKFKDANGAIFEGTISNVSKTGQLQIIRENGVQEFAFREIKYILD